ncbi:MAG TPA: glycosyltransferase, partial [Nitrospira sp.]|nr:glycosyltransferase [Nitrospira sp.]
MKIAIVAPSQVPYVQGGAERLWRGLRQAIEAEGHLCEIFNIPMRDGNFWDVIDGYKSFYDLNFDHFDILVTGKNPAWMVRHSNHYVYMLHPLRGVYDTYHLFGLGNEVVSDNLLIQAISAACDHGIETADLFGMLCDLRDQYPDSTEAALPSPLLRKVLHRLDANALEAVRGVSAISKTVAKRAEYFHGRKGIKAFYPVSTVVGEASGPGKHYLTYSRLDAPKRINLIIEGYRKARVDRPLLVVGEGPEEQKLRKLGEDAAGIKFLGRVDDGKLADLISEAHAVVFTPLMEDYGYVTAEALASGRPVITVTDSGGPTEFIKDGKNGWISEPTSEQVASSFRRAEELKDWSKMSTACKRSAAKIDWAPLIADIVDSTQTSERGRGVRPAAPRRKRILSLSTYPVHPPQGGGQARVFYM